MRLDAAQIGVHEVFGHLAGDRLATAEPAKNTFDRGHDFVHRDDDAILLELQICRNLLKRTKPEDWNFRFGEGQRSTLELGQYLAYAPWGVIEAGIAQDFAWFPENSPRFKELGPEEIPAAIEAEEQEIRRLMDGLSESDLQRPTDMQDMGQWTLGSWIQGTGLKFATAYKMQLFLYAKAAGNKNLDTWDAWMDTGGVPRPQPTEAT